MENTKTEVLIVNSEDAAIQFLQAALENNFEDRLVRIDFDSWPVMHLRYEGAKFKGTITPDMAQAIIDFQDVLNRSYSMAVNHTSSLRSLNEADRRALQIVATVQEGSSLIQINLGDWATKLATDTVGKMSGTQIVVTVLGTAVVVTSGFIVKSHLENRSEEKRLEAEIQKSYLLSKEETSRLKIVTDAMNQSAVVRETRALASSAHDSLLKSAFEADRLVVQGAVSVSGEVARKAYRSKRREPMEVQLNGNYRIKSFTWIDNFDTARVKVQKEDGSLEFLADLSVSALSKEQKIKYKDATFDNLLVYLSINATVLSDEITTAKIVSIAEQPSIK